MADLPDGLTLARHRDLAGRGRETVARRSLLWLIAILPALALAGVFGQHESSTRVAGPAATVVVRAPERLRGGLAFQARFDIRAHRPIAHPTIVLSQGWWDGMTIGNSAPTPASTASLGGGVALTYPALATGGRLRVWLSFQVNPTSFGARREDVVLADGTRPLVHLRRSLTILP